MKQALFFVIGALALTTWSGCSHTGANKEGTASNQRSSRIVAGLANPDIAGPKSNVLSEQFARIKAGGFRMGDPSDESKYEYLRKDFEIQKTEFTQAQWVSVMGENPSYFKKVEDCVEDYLEINDVKLCPNHPVEEVSWYDVQDFIKKLNRQNGDFVYRLPTEAEWEFAARAGTKTDYFFGNDTDDLKDYAWYFENSGSGTHAVGGKKANQYGLYDIYGNVSEWVEDEYADYVPVRRNGKIDFPDVLKGNRVIRGQYFGMGATNMRSFYRSYSSPEDRNRTRGFRLVRVPR